MQGNFESHTFFFPSMRYGTPGFIIQPCMMARGFLDGRSPLPRNFAITSIRPSNPFFGVIDYPLIESFLGALAFHMGNRHKGRGDIGPYPRFCDLGNFLFLLTLPRPSKWNPGFHTQPKIYWGMNITKSNMNIRIAPDPSYLLLLSSLPSGWPYDPGAILFFYDHYVDNDLEAVTMKKAYNWKDESIEITSENFRDERVLDQAVRDGILEKISYGTWRIKA